MRLFRFYSLLFLLLISITGFGREIHVSDDAGHTIELSQPATRIVSLAPDICELVFAIGAGNRLVGVVDFSDYPEQAKRIERIGDANGINLERIVALKPDLIIAWQSGNPKDAILKLKKLGFPVFQIEPRSVADIANIMRRFAVLTASKSTAQPAIHEFEQRYEQLKKQYKSRRKVSVFYEIWNQPLMTVNGEHLISKVISICGGSNIFAKLNSLAPTVAIEPVLLANPEVIIAGDNLRNKLNAWNRWTDLAAVRYQNLFLVNRDYINRHSPRILEGIKQVCESLEQARHHIMAHSQ